MLKKLAAIAALTTFAAIPAKADTLDDVVDRGTLRCGVVLDFPPMATVMPTTSQPATTLSTATTSPPRWKWKPKCCLSPGRASASDCDRRADVVFGCAP